MDRDELHNRFAYHPATPTTAALELAARLGLSYALLRNSFEHVATVVDELAPDSREKSLAVTHLEDALMWANKAVAMTTPTDDETPHVARVLPGQ